MPPRPIRNCVVVSDLHVGCQLGLMPYDGVRLDNDMRVQPTTLSDTVTGWWNHFWDVWVPEVTKGEPYCIVVNGDAIGWTEVLTRDSHNRIQKGYVPPKKGKE